MGQGQNSDNRVQKQAKAMKLRTKPHLLSCSFYSHPVPLTCFFVRILGDPYEEAKERLHAPVWRRSDCDERAGGANWSACSVQLWSMGHWREVWLSVICELSVGTKAGKLLKPRFSGKLGVLSSDRRLAALSPSCRKIDQNFWG